MYIFERMTSFFVFDRKTGFLDRQVFLERKTEFS